MVKLQKTRQNFHEFKVAAINPRPVLLTQPYLFFCEFYRTFRLLFLTKYLQSNYLGTFLKTEILQT